MTNSAVTIALEVPQAKVTEVSCPFGQKCNVFSVVCEIVTFDATPNFVWCDTFGDPD